MPKEEQASLPKFFVRLQSLTRRKEDLFTECLVAVLTEDEKLARAFVRILAGAGRIAGQNIGSAQISVVPQHSFTKHDSRVDMVIRVGQNVRIGVEHKLLAPAGQNQLAKYSGIADLTHFAVIASRSIQLGSGPKSWGKRLLHPSDDRLHFLWADFYQLVACKSDSSAHESSTMRRALAALFNANYLQAAHRYVGYLKHPEPDQQTAADTAFEKLARPTRKRLEKLGWECYDSWNSKATSEIWIQFGRSKRLAEAWMHPRYSPGALRVRLKSMSEAKRDSVLHAVRKAVVPCASHLQFVPVNLGEQARGSWAVDVIVAWNELFRRSNTRDQASRALARYVGDLVQAAS